MDNQHDVRLTPGARKILAAASTLFYDRGIHAVGVDLIAQESGVTKRTLYDRFGSKEKLVTAYLEHRHNHWLAGWEDRLEHASSPRALTIFESYAHDAESTHRGCACLNAAAELPTDHPGRRAIGDHKRFVRRRIEELLVEDDVAGDPASLAEHIFLLLEGAVAHLGFEGGERRLAGAREIAAGLLDDARPRPVTTG